MSAPESVSIIGATGALGFGLAIRLGAAGLDVVIGSRDRDRAAEAAERARAAVPGASIVGHDNARAAAANELLILSVPLVGHAATLGRLRDVLQPGQVLVDATVPLAPAVGGKATRTVGLWQGSAAEQAQEIVGPEIAVVSALHTVSATTLADLDVALDQDVLICGRRRNDKRRAAAILERITGLRCVDAGPLDQARIIEPITAMLVGINARYRTHAGIRVTGVPDGDRFPPLRAP